MTMFRFVVVGMALVLAAGGLWVRGAEAGAEEKKTVELAGAYTYGGRSSGLKVTLTPAGEGKWNAVYVASRGRGEGIKYTGVVQGDLKNGAVSGNGKSTDRRTFAFSGTAKEGVITARHTETTAGRERQTGNLTLR